VLYVPGDAEPVLELPLDPRYNKTGDVWHVLVCGLDPGAEYGFRASGSEATGAIPDRFDPRRVLIDPFSKSVAGLEKWGEATGVSGRLGRLRSRVIDEEFDWGHEHPLAGAARRLDHLRAARARLHAPRELGRRTARHLPRARREDSVPQGARSHRGRADAR
jgi:hypothetical protein